MFYRCGAPPHTPTGSPIQAAGSPQLMHAAGHGWGHGHGHGLGPRHSDSGAGHYLSAPHMLLPPRTRSQQHGEAGGGGGGGGVGGYGGAAGSTAAGMAGVPLVFLGGEAGRSGAGQEGKRQLQADEDMGMVEDDVVEVRRHDNCVRHGVACMDRDWWPKVMLVSLGTMPATDSAHFCKAHPRAPRCPGIPHACTLAGPAALPSSSWHLLARAETTTYHAGDRGHHNFEGNVAWVAY